MFFLQGELSIQFRIPHMPPQVWKYGDRQFYPQLLLQTYPVSHFFLDQRRENIEDGLKDWTVVIVVEPGKPRRKSTLKKKG